MTIVADAMKSADLLLSCAHGPEEAATARAAHTLTIRCNCSAAGISGRAHKSVEMSATARAARTRHECSAVSRSMSSQKVSNMSNNSTCNTNTRIDHQKQSAECKSSYQLQLVSACMHQRRSVATDCNSRRNDTHVSLSIAMWQVSTFLLQRHVSLSVNIHPSPLPTNTASSTCISCTMALRHLLDSSRQAALVLRHLCYDLFPVRMCWPHQQTWQDEADREKFSR